MREKYQTLSLAVLKELAKARGLRGISALKKEDLINRMVQEDEKEAAVKKEAAEKEAEEKEAAAKAAAEKEAAEKAAAEQAAAEKEAAEKAAAEKAAAEKEAARKAAEEKAAAEKAAIEKAVAEREAAAKAAFQKPNQERPGRNDRPDMVREDRGYQENRTSRVFAGRAMNGNQENRRRQNNNNGYRPSPTAQTDPQYEEQVREADAQLSAVKEDLSTIDSGNTACGILEVMPEGFGFIRSDNYMPGEADIYVSPSQIRRFNLKTGDIISGNTRIKTDKEKFSALLYVTSVNGYHPSEASRRPAFENLTPIFPDQRIFLERPGGSIAMRVVDLISPIGKGQRGMIVSQPKAGKTTLLKEIAKSVTFNNPDMHLIILLIDERPEEVTDIKEAIEGDNVEVIYSTFDETPEHHKRVSEMTIERAKRLVEHKQDVMILLDSITRLARAYNLTVAPSGRTLSGGLDPAALHMPKRFFGAARNMREGGSLTILATALVETGSKMDDVVFEEFKGTGNMELVLDRKLSEKRIFPAVDLAKSGTRREDLLLTQEELQAVEHMRKGLNGLKPEEAVETILGIYTHTRTNREFIEQVRRIRY